MVIMVDQSVLKTLPKGPGVYLFKDEDGHIMYIGKATCLYDRVKSYFQNHHNDHKADALIVHASTIDHIVTNNETEALLLEAQLIKDQQPRFNVLLKDGQPFVYLLFTKEEVPTFKLVRNKKERGDYIGPFLYKRDARAVFNLLLRTFRLGMCKVRIAQGCLDFHLGLCAGNCRDNFDQVDYLFRLELARKALQYDQQGYQQILQERINAYNKQLLFEKSREMIDYLQSFQAIVEIIKNRFSFRKYKHEIFITTAKLETDIYAQAQEQLAQTFGLTKPIEVIDCFDISHFQSSYLVGSCIRFVKGKPEKNKFRRFKIKTLVEQNDYAALQEIVQRRYRQGDLPDLVLIDGGKGQLSAIVAIENRVPLIALAKQEETIFSSATPGGIKLDVHTSMAKLLIQLRDYAHHFAVSYHRVARKKGLA